MDKDGFSAGFGWGVFVTIAVITLIILFTDNTRSELQECAKKNNVYKCEFVLKPIR